MILVLKNPIFSRLVQKALHFRMKYFRFVIFMAMTCSAVILLCCCREDTHSVGILACGHLLLKMLAGSDPVQVFQIATPQYHKLF